jgi:hypothetical protein
LSIRFWARAISSLNGGETRCARRSGPDGQLIANLVPDLELVIGKQLRGEKILCRSNFSRNFLRELTAKTFQITGIFEAVTGSFMRDRDMQNASQPAVIRKLGFTSTSTTDRAIKS